MANEPRVSKLRAPTQVKLDDRFPFEGNSWPRTFQSSYIWTNTIATLASRLKYASDDLHIAHTEGDEDKIAKAEIDFTKYKDLLASESESKDSSSARSRLLAAQEFATQTVMFHVLLEISVKSKEMAEAIEAGLGRSAESLRTAHEDGIDIAADAAIAVDALRSAFQKAGKTPGEVSPRPVQNGEAGQDRP